MLPERRYMPTDFEYRASGGGKPGTMRGYALKYNRLSQNLGGFVERVAPGAVNKTLSDNLDVLARYNHEDDYLLGRTASGTLRLTSDEQGLAYEIDLPDTTAGRDLAVLLERGDVTQSSFAFYVPPGGDEWGTTEQGFPLRTLNQVQLVDVAPVNTPAYPDTEAGLRSLAECRGLDVDQVRAAASANTLTELLAGPPVERSSDNDPQGDTHGHVTVRLRLADHIDREPPA